jgi:hypothetical protein
VISSFKSYISELMSAIKFVPLFDNEKLIFVYTSYDLPPVSETFVLPLTSDADAQHCQEQFMQSATRTVPDVTQSVLEPETIHQPIILNTADLVNSAHQSWLGFESLEKLEQHYLNDI